MYRKAIWIPFILVIALVAIWFLIKASYDLHDYLQLKVCTEVVVDQWLVQEIKSDQFAVVAYYTYSYQGKDYIGQGTVGGAYPNPWAANEAKSRYSKQKWSVWLDPKRPEKSVVEKHFPIKRTLSAVVLLGLALYFFILAVYMRFKHG